MKTLNGEAIGYCTSRLNACGGADGFGGASVEGFDGEKKVVAVSLAAELEGLNEERRKAQAAAIDEIKERGFRGAVIIERGSGMRGCWDYRRRLTEEYKYCRLSCRRLMGC